MLVYMDTAPVIYAVEQVVPYADILEQRLSVEQIILVASDLTRLECRVKPMREADAALLAD